MKKTTEELLLKIKKYLHKGEYGNAFCINEIAKALNSNWKTIEKATNLLQKLGLIHKERIYNKKLKQRITLVNWL